ncbi:MAG TPA: hypothetical protein VGG34_03365 [Opitutaceae bacterium]
MMGNLGPNAEAHTLYEYARVSAYLGQVSAAETGFKDVLVLIEKTNGAADSLRPPTLCEYARMLHDSNQDKRAVGIYRQADNSLQAARVDEKWPTDFALFLDEYAESLRAAGMANEAAEVSRRSASIRIAHPNDVSRAGQWHAYSNAGHVAETHNDWALAGKFWSRAVFYAEAERIPKNMTAIPYYELGRCLGVTGDYVGAEANLKKAQSVDMETGQHTFMDLTELARMELARGQLIVAISYYEQDLRELDSIDAANRTPAAFADLLSEYASCLKQVGRADEGSKVLARADEIRAMNPNLHSITDQTPYGKFPTT